MGLPYYIRWNSVYILSTRRRNLHEDTKKNGRSTWRILHVQINIYTYNIYLRSHKSRNFMVQVIHQDNDPQGRIRTMKYWYFPFILIKWTQDCNSYYIHRLHTVNWRQTSIHEYNWMHQEIIYNSINGWNRGLLSIYDQAWPHQDDPKDFSTRSNYQAESII